MTGTGEQLSLFDMQTPDKAKVQEEEEKLTLRYNLFDLPTAQHKAGLAGLLVMIESLRRRGVTPLPEVNELDATTVRLTVTRNSLQTIFDDLFDAEVIEVRVKSKWQGKNPKETIEVKIEKDGKKKKEKQYIYDIIQPKGLFLQAFLPNSDTGWIQLWRNMLWNILRAQPATRKVYEERAGSKSSSVCPRVFTALVKEQKQKKNGRTLTESIAGSVFVGAQDKNAELISFTGLPSQNFLLHFWHIVSLIFIPRSFSLERAKDKPGTIKWQDIGFALVIPEPSDLSSFIEDIIEALQRLEPKLAGKSNKPQRALIDLSEEGGLEYLYYLARHRSQQQGMSDCINAVEIYHIQKQGNNVRMLAADRLVPDKYILDHYERLRVYRMNPVFKSFVLPNILSQSPWYLKSMNKMASSPIELLVYAHGRTPVHMPFFGRDAGRKFTDIKEGLEHMEEEEMKSKQGRDDLLASRLYDMIRHFVRFKAEAKSGVKLKDHKQEVDGNTRYDYPPKYREAVEKVSLDAFLAMRGRREQDFVEYFTGTICSIPQFLPEEDYLLISGALIDDWEKVKALSMLAISASSYLPGLNKDKGEKS